MRKAVLVAALTAAVSMVVPASVGAWAAGTPPSRAVQGGTGQGDTWERRAGDDGLAVIGLTSGQRLVEFRTGAPSKPWQLGKVSGLKKDTKLVGIDFRVQNAKLYGVGDKGGVYTLNTRDAKAAKVSQLTVVPVGKFFGVDFNPAANRLRVISDTGQNLRHNIDDQAAPRTTTVDGPLTNPTTPPSSARGVTGAAYTNNDLNADTATSLFDIDTTNDRVSVRSPANSGPLAPTGNLGVNAGPETTSTGRGVVNQGGVVVLDLATWLLAYLLISGFRSGPCISSTFRPLHERRTGSDIHGRCSPRRRKVSLSRE